MGFSYPIALDNFRHGEMVYALAVKQHRERVEKFEAMKRPYWGDVILRPLAEALWERFPKTWKLEIMGPYGLGGAMSIYYESPRYKLFAEKSRGQCLGLTFEWRPEGLVLRDTSKDTSDYAKGTVGHMNGLHHPVHPVPPDAELGWFLRFMVETLGQKLPRGMR